MLPETMDAQKALQKLKDYLLGEDWYIVDPVGTLQANAIITDEILEKYSARYRYEKKHPEGKTIRIFGHIITIKKRWKK